MMVVPAECRPQEEERPSRALALLAGVSAVGVVWATVNQERVRARWARRTVEAKAWERMRRG